MSVQELEKQVLALSIAEQVSLAQVLWEHIDSGVADSEPADAVHEAARRDRELSSGEVAGRSYEEVMQAARKAIGCD